MKTNKHLWYDRPAKNWNEALPLGNGRLGVMVYGATDINRNNSEIIQLNEESLWVKPEIQNRVNPDAKKYLSKIRELIMKGEIIEAEIYAKSTMMGTPKFQSPYQSLGEMHLFFDNHRDLKPANYTRALDLGTATMYIEYNLEGVTYTRELFVSAVDQVMVMKLTSSEKEKLNFITNLSRKPINGKSYKYNDTTIVLEGSAGAKGVAYASMVSAQTMDGTISVLGDHIKIDNATEAIIYFDAKTDYFGDDYLKVCEEHIHQAKQYSYEELKARHIKEYKSYFDRVDFQLDTPNTFNHYPTDNRLKLLQQRDDERFATLYFDYGRYLLISSSRPGTKAANMQGIWNDMLLPPWESKYTVNINIQMNYWPAELCNLSECHEPLFDLLEDSIKSGRRTARDQYGCKGFVIHHNIDGFGDAAPVDENISSTIWPMGGAWLALHLWDHYCYTEDKDFLEKRALPIMKECIEFFFDYMIEDKDGQLLTGPSVSPENCYIRDNGRSGYLCLAPTMDNQILRELFKAYLKSAILLDVQDDFYESVEQSLSKLPDNKIGEDGRLLEWLEEYGEKEPGHRHISHLFGLYPGSQISVTETPELANAAKASLEYRLKHGGGHTGWSRAWIINYWARLLDSEKALHNIHALFESSTLPNLLDDHPPFQIDGNFGATAGIAEMLMQSKEGVVTILPCLPKAWSTGHMNGLRARGGMELNIEWKDHRLYSLSIHSSKNQKIILRYNNEGHKVQLSKGMNTIYVQGEKQKF